MLPHQSRFTEFRYSRYCMRLGSSSSEQNFSNIDYQSNAPDLPPRHTAVGRGIDRLSSNSNFDICPSAEGHSEFKFTKEIQTCIVVFAQTWNRI